MNKKRWVTMHPAGLARFLSCLKTEYRFQCFQTIAGFFPRLNTFLYCCCFLCQSVNREIPSFFLVTIASRNWQKTSHLGSSADKRCDILTTGIPVCCCHSTRPYAPLGAKKLSGGGGGILYLNQGTR